jgi:hypothetical protein
MSHPTFRFLFQNAPGLPFTKWCKQFDESLKDRNAKTFVFADKSIANSCFVKSVLSHKIFLNIFCSENIFEELPLIQENIKKHCESMLLKGMFSECKLDFNSSKYENLVLRDYNQINISDMFGEEWQFYYLNKAKLFYKLSEYYANLPFSYIWSFFFSESNTEALVADEYVKKNVHIFSRHMKLVDKPEDNKKYKIIYLDTMNKKVNINVFMEKLEQNGLLLLKNLDADGPNMVGWRDLRNRMLGIIRI